jgi:hypothetical protein
VCKRCPLIALDSKALRDLGRLSREGQPGSHLIRSLPAKRSAPTQLLGP